MAHVSRADLKILAAPAELAQCTADWLLAAAREKRGVFAVALSGGATPRGLYERLAQSPYREAFPWSRTHWFWGDERFVPHDDAASNYGMVCKAMLSHVPAPEANIHAIATEHVNAATAALAYEAELKSFHGSERLDAASPLFDVVLMGLGSDGHTASLFPGSPVLDEQSRWVAAVDGPGGDTRITLTYPVLESAQRAAFLVAGAAKREILGRVLSGEAALPAARFDPVGSLSLFADIAAAGEASP